MVDHVYNNYVVDPKTGRKTTRLYSYGASLGALLLGAYLVRAKNETKLDGACMYACPYDVVKGEKFFYTTHFGFYSWLIGVNLADGMHNLMPQLLKHCDDDKFADRIRHSFATNWSGLKKIDLDLYIPMFGFKNCEDYY